MSNTDKKTYRQETKRAIGESFMTSQHCSKPFAVEWRHTQNKNKQQNYGKFWQEDE